MGSRGIDPLILNSYRKRQRRIAMTLIIVIGIIFTTFLGLIFSASSYSLATTINLIANLDQFRLADGGYDPDVVRILATNIAIAAFTALAIIVLAIFAAKSFQKSKLKVASTPVRRSSYQGSSQVTPAQTAQPVALQRHTNFNNTSPLPEVVSSAATVVAPRTFAEPTPQAPTPPPQEIDFLAQFRLNVPEGLSIPENLNIPPNVTLEPAAPLSEELPAPNAVVGENSQLSAEQPLAKEPETDSVKQNKRRYRSTHESAQALKLPSKSKLIIMVISVGLIAGISAAVAVMATNRLSQENDGTYVQKFFDSTFFSPSFMGDISRGLLNPEVAQLWLLALIVIILCVQAVAITTIAKIMITTTRHRTSAAH